MIMKKLTMLAFVLLLSLGFAAASFAENTTGTTGTTATTDHTTGMTGTTTDGTYTGNGFANPFRNPMNGVTTRGTRTYDTSYARANNNDVDWGWLGLLGLIGLAGLWSRDRQRSE
jgi:hypothetical protein